MAKLLKSKKHITYHEKNRPATWFYVLIMLICTIIRFTPISTGFTDMDDALNDFAVGAAASTWAALLIAELDCHKQNKALARKKRMVFAEYFNSISELRFIVAKRCKNFSREDDLFTFNEWLRKLSDVSNYPQNLSSSTTMDRAYFHISTAVKHVKATLLSLQQQYCILVEADIIDTDDFRQHIVSQINLCNEICDTLELTQYKLPGILCANDLLIHLVSASCNFFDDPLEEQYPRIAKG